MPGQEILLPIAAYELAEQAARDVTKSNAAEYGRAGMHVGARWGGVAELTAALVDVELHHGTDDPAAVAIRNRIAELREGRTIETWEARQNVVEALRGAAHAARQLDPAIGYPIAELFREMHRDMSCGYGYSWGIYDAACEAAEAVKRAAARASSGDAA